MTDEKDYVLTLPLGDIRGQICQSIYDQSYFSFEGIPFAEPPLGPLRFRASKPVKPWEGTKNCTKCGNKPLQMNFDIKTVEGSEDCLYLNVYTKKFSSERPLPVMVYIYGGSFRSGEASRHLYSPDYFMSENVVLVTFNYRLCSLGFISFADPNLKIPGNAGLKDQALALKWVQENISCFNGDPKNVTVFGESAGAASTHYLMLSEQGRDLFRRAICMSGTALNYWAHMPQKNMAFRLARFHGYTGDNIDLDNASFSASSFSSVGAWAHINDLDVYNYLNALEPEKLVKHSLLSEEEIRNTYLFSFGPIIEPYVGEDCFIPEKPLHMLKNAWSNNIAMMMGGSSFEGLLLYREAKTNPGMIRRLFNEPELIVPEEVRSKRTLKQNRKLGEKLLKIHFSPASPDDSSIFPYLEIYSFKIFWHDFHRVILARLSFARAPTFLYRFDYDSPDFNLYRAKYCNPDKIRGVAHADELSYLFYSNDSRMLLPQSDEYKILRRMIGMWTAFATSGDPDCNETKPVIWDAVTKYQNLRALNINKKLEFRDLPEKEKLEVWAKLYPNAKHLCGASTEEDYYWGEPMPTML